MLVAHYIGPPKPGLAAKLGWHATVLAQKAPHDRCTHTEAIHAVHDDLTVTMCSSSLVDRGVRRRERVALNPKNWVITDVDAFDVQKSIDYFNDAIARKVQYDKRGALATILPGREDIDKVFCTESVLAPYIPDAHYFTPAHGLAICLGLGRVVQLSETYITTTRGPNG